ncbi:uncharacterized protein LOC118184588 [Stegodyphus dumicola]|uniref:uncharacterized protein LOC118184588 n=1 Tax=Stegodyphus dumicola TaxID=202533 RepID=UPI0015A7D68F|nr:uncharacterized protein LOC118184588 [Stegodyphus dumicola]
MAIKGGASYILRGDNQLVYLEAGKHSEDPDDPENKEFKVEWTCRYLEARYFLPEGEEYDPKSSFSSRSITPYQVAEKEFKDECFSTKNGAKAFKETNLVLNTRELRSFDALYEFTLTISKDSRKNQSWIYLDVIKDKPPGIIIMCEKKVACTIYHDGFIINPSDWLPVRAECVTDCGNGKIAYDWNIYGINDVFDAVDLQEWKDFVVIDEDRLGINRTFFQHFHDFKYFHVQVTGIDTIEDRPKGVAKLHLKINNSPKPGLCVSPLMTGLAMIGIFRIEFVNWTDPDKHTLVDYSLYMNYEGKKFRLHYGVKTSVDFILPPGECEVICTVQDQLGAVTSLTVGKIMVSKLFITLHDCCY